MKRLLLAALATLVLLAGCGQTKRPEADPDKLLMLHNEERSKLGHRALVIDQYLSEYAKGHSEWMARRNAMRHSDISDLIGKYRTAGENIAWNQRDEQEVFKAWMNSRPHRSNILNKNFSKVGFGMSRNSKGQPYWCTVFGD